MSRLIDLIEEIDPVNFRSSTRDAWCSFAKTMFIQGINFHVFKRHKVIPMIKQSVLRVIRWQNQFFVFGFSSQLKWVSRYLSHFPTEMFNSSSTASTNIWVKNKVIVNDFTCQNASPRSLESSRQSYWSPLSSLSFRSLPSSMSHRDPHLSRN